MAKLIIARDANIMRTVQLNKERISIGRHRSNDIVLDEATISGHHAVIVTILDDSFLEDLNSTNGSFVNGHRVGKHFLQHLDRITLAKLQIEFQSDGVRPLSAAAGVPLLAHIQVLNGANAGKKMLLDKEQTTLGRAGAQVVVISRTQDAYAISHVEGAQAPLVNGVSLGKQPLLLRSGDIIDLTGTQLAFTLA
ncbi:hypothetical protein AAKU55_005146 [Oxalobacteraceae bacterium GrIS 1.11]